MDAGLKAKWIAALRSGEFKQHRGGYVGVDAYCCLGVLACIQLGRDPEGEMECVRLFSTTATLWAQVGDDQQESLVNLNDAEGKTFPEIADYIEANL